MLRVSSFHRPCTASGDPTSIRDLSSALDLVSPSRNKLVFVNSGLTGGDISAVINEVEYQIGSFGGDVQVLEQERDLLSVCRSSIRGSSSCIAGAVFYSSPSEGPDGIWKLLVAS